MRELLKNEINIISGGNSWVADVANAISAIRGSSEASKFVMVADAARTPIKSIGEALSEIARKQ